MKRAYKPMIEWSKANPRICPTCKAWENSVQETREGIFGEVVRWRKCSECGHRWKTIEIMAAMLEERK